MSGVPGTTTTTTTTPLLQETTAVPFVHQPMAVLDPARVPPEIWTLVATTLLSVRNTGNLGLVNKYFYVIIHETPGFWATVLKHQYPFADTTHLSEDQRTVTCQYLRNPHLLGKNFQAGKMTRHKFSELPRDLADAVERNGQGFVCTTQGEVMCYDLHTQQLLYSFKSNPLCHASYHDLSWHGPYLALFTRTDEGKALILWKPPQAEECAQENPAVPLEPLLTIPRMQNICISGDGDKVYFYGAVNEKDYADERLMMHCWDIQKNELVGEPRSLENPDSQCIGLCAEGDYLYYCSSDEKIIEWDWMQNKQTMLRDLNNKFYGGLSISRYGRYLMVSGMAIVKTQLQTTSWVYDLKKRQPHPGPACHVVPNQLHPVDEEWGYALYRRGNENAQQLCLTSLISPTKVYPFPMLSDYVHPTERVVRFRGAGDAVFALVPRSGRNSSQSLRLERWDGKWPCVSSYQRGDLETGLSALKAMTQEIDQCPSEDWPQLRDTLFTRSTALPSCLEPLFHSYKHVKNEQNYPEKGFLLTVLQHIETEVCAELLLHTLHEDTEENRNRTEQLLCDLRKLNAQVFDPERVLQPSLVIDCVKDYHRYRYQLKSLSAGFVHPEILPRDKIETVQKFLKRFRARVCLRDLGHLNCPYILTKYGVRSSADFKLLMEGLDPQPEMATLVDVLSNPYGQIAYAWKKCRDRGIHSLAALQKRDPKEFALFKGLVQTAAG